MTKAINQSQQSEDMEVVSAYIPKHKKESLRALAKADGRTLSGLLNRLVDQALAIGMETRALPDPANSEAALAAIGSGNGAD